MNADIIKSSFSRRFHALRRRYLALNLGIWLCVVIASALAAWILAAVYDYIFEAPVELRRILLGTAILAIVAIAIPSLLRLIESAQQHRFASLLEKTFTQFGQRLRTILDVLAGRVRGPEAMLGALANQTLGRWETIPLRQVLPTKRFLTSAVVLFVLSISVLVLSSSAGQWRIAMLRAAGNNAAYTEMSVSPGDAEVIEGANASAKLDLTGRPERIVSVRYRMIPAESDRSAAKNSSAGDWIQARLSATSVDQAADGPKRLDYQMDFGKMTNDIEYQFVSSVGETPVYRLTVLPLIRVTSVSTTVKSPAYTRLEERAYDSTDVTLLKDSDVRVTIVTSHPLDNVALKVGTTKRDMQAIITPERGTQNAWTFSLPCDQSLYWTFEGSSNSGVPMDPVVGRLRVRNDAEPKLHWRSPSDGFEAHSLAELPMNVIATDDYGLEEVGIVFQLGEEQFVLKEWSSAPADNVQESPSTKVDVENVLPLESLELTEHEYVAYYAYAIDNCQGQPHRTETDIRYVDIRPLRQEYALREREPGDFASDGQRSLFQSLGEIIRRQRFVINRTRRFVQALPNDPMFQLNTIDRLVENQSELASLVRFLAERLAAQGSDRVEALNQAETLMLRAADSLSVGEFSVAFTQENDALRALVEARNQVLNLIENDPQMRQARMMREIARQLRQKLRLERPRSDIQIADTLEALALDQSQITNQIQALQSQPDSNQLHIATDDESTEEQDKSNSKDALAIEDEIRKQQLNLQDRFAEIVNDLEEQAKNSALLGRRLKEATSFYETMERGPEWKEFEANSEDLAALLNETAIHVRSLSPTEPVARISELRSMASAMSGFERQLARLPQDQPSESNSQIDVPIDMLVKRSAARSETANDVLQLPVDVGDVETSEVNDYLAQFAQQTNVKELLESSRSVFQELQAQGALSQADAKSRSDEAISRSKEYQDVARMLDELYQQLMTPKLDQLRRLENQAGQISTMMSAAASALPGNREQEDQEIDENLRQLQKGLQEASLDELLDLVQPSDEISGKSQDVGNAGREYLFKVAGKGEGRPDERHMQKLLHELRSRIQQMILLEISPDRDVAVPQRYKQAVDNYFERIAASSDEPNSETP